jgi:uncharacterized protein (TIGR02996 family)
VDQLIRPAGFHPVLHGDAVDERRHSLSWCIAPNVAWDDTHFEHPMGCRGTPNHPQPFGGVVAQVMIRMNEEASFLDGIKANPEDVCLRLVYADWLEERGDRRSEYLRVDSELQRLIASLSTTDSAVEPKVRQLGARLRKLSRTLDAAWVAIFDRLRPKFVRCRVCRKLMSAKEAIDTDPRSYRKTKTSRYCKLCFEDAVRSRLHRGLDSSGRHSRDYHGGASDDH